MRAFHALNIVYNLNRRAEASHWRNNTKSKKSAQKGGFRKLHTYLRGDGERTTVSIAGRGTEHSWRKKRGPLGVWRGERRGDRRTCAGRNDESSGDGAGNMWKEQLDAVRERYTCKGEYKRMICGENVYHRQIDRRIYKRMHTKSASLRDHSQRRTF